MPIRRRLGAWLLGALFVAAGLSVGCRDYHDHHHDDSQQTSVEAPYYNRWEQETHRQHKEFNQRTEDEKKDYQDWRRQQR